MEHLSDWLGPPREARTRGRRKTPSVDSRTHFGLLQQRTGRLPRCTAEARRSNPSSRNSLLSDVEARACFSHARRAELLPLARGQDSRESVIEQQGDTYTRAAMTILVLSFIAACGDGRQPADLAAPTPAPAEVRIPSLPEQIALPPPAEPRHPLNIILISIDTLRADHLSTYGYASPTSPAIDRLAAEGVVFEQAYSHSPKTAPSHMSLMTSVHPGVHRVLNTTGGPIDSQLSLDIPTLPQILRQAGYRTAAFTAGANLASGIGFGRGFESYEELPIDAATTFEAGIEQLRKWDDGDPRPFFLFLHTVQVHDPYLPPARERDLFTDPEYAGPITSDRAELAKRASQSGRRVVDEFWELVDLEDPTELRHLKALYDACIRYTDEQVGRLLAAASALGRDQDTLIVLLSDHGEEFMEHGGTRHNSLFDELLQVPLILRLPAAMGTVNGRRVTTPVRLVDVMPTLLELVGLPSPPHLEGESVLPLLTEGDESTRYVFAHWRELGARSLRVGPWKMIRIPGSFHVFNLEDDPGERTPLEQDRPDVVAALARSLKQLMEAARQTSQIVRPGEHAPIDEATRTKLRALGYIE